MEATHDFLLRLGLDEGADERAIRHAYARRVKQIDQARDPAGFQDLREAYETALDWAQHREVEQGEEEADQRAILADPAVLPGVSSADTAALAETEADVETDIPAQEQAAPDEAERALTAVWERYQAGVAQMAAAQRLADVDAWEEVLRARLADDELINIDARMQFEWRIVTMLGTGWQPGHESLFPAAIDVFKWAQERRALAQFGYYGNLLNQAIDEYNLFFTQAITVRSVQQRITMLLRREEQANSLEIVQSMGDLRAMQARFPALLFLVTNPDNIAHWEATYEAYDPNQPRILSPREKRARWFLRIVLAVLALKFFHFMYELEPPPEQRQSMADAAQHEPTQNSQAVAQGDLPSHELLMAHIASFDYQPPSGTAWGDYALQFDVTLDEAGKVTTVTTLRESGLPDFDAKVAAAIRASRPFPPNVARNFKVDLTASFRPPKDTEQQTSKPI